MLEYRVPNKEFVATYDFHKDRPAAHHMEQPENKIRLLCTAALVEYATLCHNVESIVDCGCGDGGLLQYLKQRGIGNSVGYDFHGPGVKYARDARGVSANYANFLENLEMLTEADLTIMSEVLEHLDDPHTTLQRISSSWIVVSSPNNETQYGHADEHQWVWDRDGYVNMISKQGWVPYQVVDVHNATIVLAGRL